MFKYYSHAAAVATLQNQTIQFSAPAAFNDPFDTHLEDPLGLDPADFVGQLNAAFVEFILGDIDYAALRHGPHQLEIVTMHRAIQAAAPEQREELRKGLLADDTRKFYDIGGVDQKQPNVVGLFLQRLQQAWYILRL